MRIPLAVCLALTVTACAEPLVMRGVEFRAAPGSGEPNLYPTRDGHAVLTWLEPTADGQHALRLAVRDARGWSAPSTVAESDRFFVNWADFPSFTEMPDGSWAVHWLGKVAAGTYAYHVNVAISRDAGATWSAPVVPHRDTSPGEHGFVSMVPFAEGAALIWLDGQAMGAGEADAADGARAGADHGVPAGAMQLRFTTITATGELADDVLIDDRVCECCQTALARTNSGLLAAYRDRSPEEIRNIAVARYADGSWSAPRDVADDKWHYPGCPVNGPQLSALGDTVAIAWYTAPEQLARVQVAFSADGGSTWSEPVRVDEGDPLGRVDIELLDAGDVVVTWLERGDPDAVVRARRVTRRGKLGKPWNVAATTEARASGFPRMVKMGDELVFAWTLTGDGGGVRVAATPIP